MNPRSEKRNLKKIAFKVAGIPQLDLFLPSDRVAFPSSFPAVEQRAKLSDSFTQVTRMREWRLSPVSVFTQIKREKSNCFLMGQDGDPDALNSFSSVPGNHVLVMR